MEGGMEGIINTQKGMCHSLFERGPRHHPRSLFLQKI